MGRLDRERRRTAVENARDTLEEREQWYREAARALKAAKRELDKLSTRFRG